MTEIELLRDVAAAAADYERIAAELIKIDEVRIVTTDIGGAAMAERMTRLTKALTALKEFRALPTGLSGSAIR